MLPDPRVARAPLRTRHGEFTIYVFSWSDNEQDNVLALLSDKRADVPMVRIQSACYTGEIFESFDCDCHWQLDIYMLRDGRAAGLLTKIRGMALSDDRGIDTADAYQELGVPADPRHYDQAAYVVRYFGVVSLRLLTNNPRKVDGLVAEGLRVERIGLESEPTDYNRDYLRSKALKLGHWMQAFGTDV
jgi:GTP cyclohydrolase II